MKKHSRLSLWLSPQLHPKVELSLDTGTLNGLSARGRRKVGVENKKKVKDEKTI